MLLAEEGYVSETEANFDSLGYNALHGLIGGLDSYSSYLSGPEFEAYDIPTRQSYAGIGAEVREIDGKVYITGLNPEGGALDAGFSPGDWIVEVDGEEVVDGGVSRIVSLLRGEAGTEVELGVRRTEADEVIRRTVERRNLNFSSLREVSLLEGDIGYLSIGVFGKNTADEMAEELLDLRSKGAEGFVIDVRNNPGGLLTAALRTVDLFIPPGQEILTVRGREESVIERFLTENPLMVPVDVPLVVIQNRFSASASEIFAGSLQALQRAKVVGEVSHGKGSVQSVYEFEGGDGLSMTTARYVLPGGAAIEGVGLEPDETVEVSEEDILRISIQEAHDFGLTEDQFTEKFGFSKVEDAALIRAIEIIRDQPDLKSDAGA